MTVCGKNVPPIIKSPEVKAGDNIVAIDPNSFPATAVNNYSLFASNFNAIEWKSPVGLSIIAVAGTISLYAFVSVLKAIFVATKRVVGAP